MKNRTKQWPQVKQWLRVKGFCIGNTMTGWTAVNRTGIVVTASNARVKVWWPMPGDGINERRADEASMPWMQWALADAERDVEACAREADQHNREWRTTDGEGSAKKGVASEQ